MCVSVCVMESNFVLCILKLKLYLQVMFTLTNGSNLVVEDFTGDESKQLYLTMEGLLLIVASMLQS